MMTPEPAACDVYVPPNMPYCVDVTSVTISTTLGLAFAATSLVVKPVLDSFEETVVVALGDDSFE